VTYLVYVSSAVRPLSDEELMELLRQSEELMELLRQSRENNARHGITGLLLYKDGNFMQYLEGPAEEVARLHEKILADRRHKQVITLLRGEAENRHFEAWAMAFENVTRLSEGDPASASRFLDAPLTEESFGSSPHKALRLLLSFKRTMG
jgi:hypothetical protein